MKDLKVVALSLITIAIFTGSLAAQNFVSAKGGFTIALPASGAKVEAFTDADGQGENIKWDLKEGMIAITYGNYSSGVSFKTARDIAYFFEGVKQGIVEVKPTTLVESAYSAGSFAGTSFTATVNGNTYRTRALAAMGTKYFIISGLSKASQPGSDAAILKALDSFEFTAPVK